MYSYLAIGLLNSDLGEKNKNKIKRENLYAVIK